MCSHGKLAISDTSLRHTLHVEDLCDNVVTAVLGLLNPASVSMLSPSVRYFCSCHSNDGKHKHVLTCTMASSLH